MKSAHSNRFTALVLVCLVLPLLLAPTSARAKSSVLPSWVSWEFSADFSNHKVNGMWFVTIGGLDKTGAEVELITKPFAIKCDTSRGVVLGASYADFQGGHVTCYLPDLMDTANAIISATWGAQYNLRLDPDCQCVPLRDKTIWSEADAEPNRDGFNPVLTHPSLAFGLNTDGTVTANVLRVDRQADTGLALSAIGRTTYHSEYDCDNAGGGCKFVHSQNGRYAGDASFPHTVPSFITGKTTVTIGMDPATGETFEGRLWRAKLDPGCRMQ